MIPYADTSFIVALFAGEAAQWRKAWKWWHAAGLCQVMVSRLTMLESENAFHALRVDHKITPAELREAQNGLVRTRMEGLLACRETPPRRLYPEAHRLVSHYSARAAYGALDYGTSGHFTAVHTHRRHSPRGKWFAAFCQEVPEANGQGRTEAEAVQSLRAAVDLVFQDRREDVCDRARITPPLRTLELAHA